MLRSLSLAALMLLAAAPSLPRAPEPAKVAAPHRAYPAIDEIRWTYGDASHAAGSEGRLRFSREQHGLFNSSVGPEGASDVQAAIASIERARPDEAISFRLSREAGALACTGRAEGNGRAAGTCRFDPDENFAAGLAQRGIAADDSDDLLALAILDAHLATVDRLRAQGFRFADNGDLIAVSALAVTPEYVDDLRAAGLKIDELGDLIAAKALKIDGRWLGEMARAGYPSLAVGDAIQMRALGVTPDYALKMGRVLRAVHEIE